MTENGSQDPSAHRYGAFKNSWYVAKNRLSQCEEIPDGVVARSNIASLAARMRRDDNTTPLSLSPAEG